MSESELRQRSGQKTLLKASADSAALKEGKDDGGEKEQMMRSLESAMQKIQEGPAPSISHLTKSCKDRLAEDPYNLNLILDLGMAYAKDRHWERCANVMLRGWKRVKEFEEHEVRCQFLIILCQASLAQGKFRQAMAVLGDMEEPVEEHNASRVEALRCNVYCSNGDASAGLKAFHKAIKGQDFDVVLAIWGSCHKALQQVGACEVAKNAIEALAVDDTMKNKIKLTEMIANLKKSCSQDAKPKVWLMRLRVVSLVLFLAMACYWLHRLETWNLQNLKIKP